MAKALRRSADRLKVFISYSRKDRSTVEPLRDALISAGFEAYLDLHDILPGEPWRERLGSLIETADTVVFALSPDLVASAIVDWEVNEAERLGKRILPVVIRDAEPDRVPGRIKRLNYIFMRDAAERVGALQNLADALRTDIQWIREHTRLGEFAAQWERGGRAEDGLLRGAPLTAAERWISERPREAPEKQRAFLQASRDGEERRLEQEKARLAEVAGAQARTRRAQRRTFGVLTLMAVGVVGGLWGVYGFWQSVMLNRAEFIASQAEDQVGRASDPVTGMLLALEALPDAAATRAVQRLMPREASAKHALDGAWRNDTVRQWRERRPLSGHTDGVRAVAFAPDGRLVLTGSNDNTARLWEAASGRLVATLSGHTSPVTAVAFAPDGRLVLTGSNDNTARLWEAAGGRLVATLSDTGTVRTVAFSPDSRLVLTGSDAMMRLWEPASGRPVATLSGHTGAGGVAFSPDGWLVLTGSIDNTARLWEAASGKPVATLSGHTKWVRAVAFAPDGRLVLTGSEDGTARLWEPASGRLVATLSGHTSPVKAVAFAPDGRLVLTGSDDNTARLWEPAGGKHFATLFGHTSPVTAVAFSPDGRLVLTGSEDGRVRLWEPASGRLVATLSGHTLEVKAVAFSPDGQLVLTGSWDGTARLWEVASGRPVATLSGHTLEVTAVAFSRDGRLVLTSSNDNTARLWETASGKAVATLSGHMFMVGAVAFSPDGRLVLTGSVDNTVRLWPVLGTQALVDAAKATVPRCLTPAQRQRFHLTPDAPRWCYERKLWPYDNATDSPPPPPAWDERLLAAWDWLVPKASSRMATARP